MAFGDVVREHKTHKNINDDVRTGAGNGKSLPVYINDQSATQKVAFISA